MYKPNIFIVKQQNDPPQLHRTQLTETPFSIHSSSKSLECYLTSFFISQSNSSGIHARPIFLLKSELDHFSNFAMRVTVQGTILYVNYFSYLLTVLTAFNFPLCSQFTTQC